MSTGFPERLTRYEGAITAFVEGRAGRSELAAARSGLLQAVGRGLRELQSGDDALEALRLARKAVLGAGLPAPVMAFEEGAIDAAALLVRNDEAAMLHPALRAVVRNAQNLRVLQVLRDTDELGNRDLAIAARVRGGAGPATESEESQMSRRVATLREHGLVYQVQVRRERLVRLTDAGRALLAQVDRGHVPEAPRPEPAEIPEALLRPMLRDAARRPHIDWDPSDRSRFYLFLGGLHVANALLARDTWSATDRILANLVWQHPLSDYPYDDDMDAFQLVAARWPHREDATRRDLMRCLFRHQQLSQRGELARDLLQLADGLQDGDPFVLLWAPAAVNVAAWARDEAPELEAPLLAAVDRFLASFPDVPLALHQHAFVATQRGDYATARRLWQRVPLAGNPVEGPLSDAIARADSQLLASAELNGHILSLDEAIADVVVEHAPRFRLEARLRDGGWWPDLLSWLDTEAEQIVPALAARADLKDRCRDLLACASRVERNVGFESGPYHLAVDIYRQNARFVSSLSGLGTVRRLDPGPDSRRELEQTALNHAYGVGQWTAHWMRQNFAVIDEGRGAA